MKRFAIRNRASFASACLEKVWAELRGTIPGLPPCVLVIIDAGGRGRKRGHFSPSCWSYRSEINAHEVGLSPNLFEFPVELLETLLHEASHTILFEKGLNGGCNGYYHKKEFRDCCRELGLQCEFYNGRYGWTLTSFPNKDQVPEKYDRALRFLDALPLGTGGPRPQRVPGKKLPGSGHVRLSCNCSHDRAVYVNKRVYAKGGIVCRFCGTDFRLRGIPAAKNGPNGE